MRSTAVSATVPYNGARLSTLYTTKLRFQSKLATGGHRKAGNRIVPPSLHTAADAPLSETDLELDYSFCNETDGREKKYVGKRAIVVGAGPAGTTAAAHLAKQGFTVKLYEKRGPPTTNAATDERSRMMSLTAPTVEVLRKGVGLKLPDAESKFVNGMVLSRGSITLGPDRIRFTTIETSSKLYTCNRNLMTRSIIEAASKIYADTVSFHFNYGCEAVDFDKRIAQFKDEKGTIVEEEYDLLVAADGVNSCVRNELVNFDRSFKIQRFESDKQYKYVFGLSKLPASEDLSLMPWGKTIFNVFASKGSPCDSIKRFSALIILRSNSGEMGAVVVTDEIESLKGHEEKWLKDNLPDYFPQIWIDDIAKGMRDVRPSQMSPFVLLPRLYGPSTIFVGDAGHSVTAYISYGVNLAIGDSKALEAALDDADGDVDSLPEKYNRRRFGNIKAAQIMQLMITNIGLQLTKLIRFQSAFFQMHQLTCAVIRQKFPNLVSKPRMERFASGEEPSVILSDIYREMAIFAAIFVAAAASLSMLVWLLIKGLIR